MNYASSALLTTVALFGASVVFAQNSLTQPVEPPADSPIRPAEAPSDDAGSMHMTAEEMRDMPSPAAPDTASIETHAPDSALERPAISQHAIPPMMQGMDTDMNDAGLYHRVWLENLEGVYGTPNGGAWDAQAWFGGDFDKWWIKSEGSVLAANTRDAKVEALWAHAVRPFWDSQLGIRHDFSGGPAREWAAFGIQGISPYWFDLELTGYVGEEARTALRLKTEYDLYLTQRFVLKPEIELNAYGKPDRVRDLGAGLADGQFELRLRYEFSRRVAPYAGYVYERKFAGSAVLARDTKNAVIDHRVVAGLECFF